MTKTRLAPVGISTYSRLSHLQQTVSALRSNVLASETDLYIFSDAPRPGDEEKVQSIRKFIRSIDGFKNVEIVERKSNSRVFNNRDGMRMLLMQYGRMIFMEEDIITAPSFLQFMNYMLDAYADFPEILSISGYSPPIYVPKNYPYDIFFYPRFDPWGFGIWKDRFDMIQMDIPRESIRSIYKSPINIIDFAKVGLDVLPASLSNYYNFKDNLDAKIYTQQYSLGMYSIHPIMHLVDNIGLDGTGMHPKKKTWFRVDLDQREFRTPVTPPEIIANPKIIRKFYHLRSGGWAGIRQVGWLMTVLFKILIYRISGKIK